ncbi:MAG: hypothetical protein VB120_04395 [Lachnospiraceae bacterium]|nr:hypothetical protein [Lachnospiraceae bacterium]
MKKKHVIPCVVGAILIILSISFFAMRSRSDGSTLESRELRLSELSKLDGDAHISCEIEIDGYIVSGYSNSNDKYGLAIFEPQKDGKYQYQTNTTRENDELVFMTTTINQKSYNLFWANKADLDYAEITYTLSGIAGETVKLDAKDNVIIYTEAPAKDFSVEYCFVDKNGDRFE